VLKGSRKGKAGHSLTDGGLYSSGKANGEPVAAADACRCRAEPSVAVAVAEPDAERRAVATERGRLIMVVVVRGRVSVGVIKDGTTCEPGGRQREGNGEAGAMGVCATAGGGSAVLAVCVAGAALRAVPAEALAQPIASRAIVRSDAGAVTAAKACRIGKSARGSRGCSGYCGLGLGTARRVGGHVYTPLAAGPPRRDTEGEATSRVDIAGDERGMGEQGDGVVGDTHVGTMRAQGCKSERRGTRRQLGGGGGVVLVVKIMVMAVLVVGIILFDAASMGFCPRARRMAVFIFMHAIFVTTPSVVVKLLVQGCGGG
jgi:hypothetical protein